MSKQIKIPITEEELSRIQNGKTFDWTFNNIDVEIFKQEMPTEDEIIEYMNAYNEDEVGLNNPIDYEEAEYQLLLSDKYHK